QCAFNNSPGGVDNSGPINCISYNNGGSNVGNIVNETVGTITPTHAYPPIAPGTASGISVVGPTTLRGDITNNGTITNALGSFAVNIGGGAYSGGLISSAGASLAGSITNN